MQTTLLSIAIALILALTAALVGPHFVDWTHYRSEFETRAAAFTGLSVRAAGPIDVRLLPTPTLTLHNIEVASPGRTGGVRARGLDIAFSLSALMRGELQASEARLDGPEFAIGIDDAGRLQWPIQTGGLDLEALSIQRLDIVDGRATLSDTTSGRRFAFDKVQFRGELRSLIGPMKGEGTFDLAGQTYPFRFGAGRRGDDGSFRLRLGLDQPGRSLSADADVLVSTEAGVPRFDGTVQVGRPASRSPEDGTVQPWRVTSRIKGDSAGAVFDQLEFQYGPDERATKLRGDARLTLGRQPQLVVGLASSQVDLDRLLALPEDNRRPLLALRSVANQFGSVRNLPLPVKVGLSIENLTFAGAVIQRVSGEFTADAAANGDAWKIDALEFRAPGMTTMRLGGRLDVSDKGMAFSGPVRVDARDPRAFVAWLTDRTAAQGITSSAMKVEGDVQLGGDMIAIDRLKAELDRMTVEGRLAYVWPQGDRAPRIDAVLSAPDIDVDRLSALAQGFFQDTMFEWPREGTLALKVDRASVYGVELKQADVSLQFDRQRIEVERFSVGDFGGAALGVKGRIDTRDTSRVGELALTLDARSLDGIVALLERLSPPAAAAIRARTAAFVPARIQASVSVNPEQGNRAGAPTTANVKIDGKAGVFSVALQGSAAGPSDAFNIVEPERLRAAILTLTGALDATDGGALVQLLGLEPAVVVGNRPGRLALKASGPISGDIALDSQLTAAGLDLATTGTVRVFGSGPSAANLSVKLAAPLRSPRTTVTGRPSTVPSLPATLTARMRLDDGVVDVSDLNGKVAGVDLSGRLKATLGNTVALDGDLDVGDLDFPAVLGGLIGSPLQGVGTPAAGVQAGPPAATATWPNEPFTGGLFGSVSGRIAVRSARVSFTPKLAARDGRAVLRFGASDVALTDVEAMLAGGRVSGEMNFQRSADGLRTRSRFKIAGADVTELVRGGPPPVAGRLALDANVEGSGRSPAALIGSLQGNVAFSLEDGRIAQLDPAAFGAVIRSIDQGLPIDPERIRERMEQLLPNSGLALPRVDGEMVVAGGYARLQPLHVTAQGSGLAVPSASVALADGLLDTRLTMTGPAWPDAPVGGRQEIVIALKGPIDSVKRSVDVTAFASWLALRLLEQQTKRINALESGREQPAEPVARAAPVVIPQVKPEAPETSPPPRGSGPKASIPREGASRENSQREHAPRAVENVQPPRAAPARPRPPSSYGQASPPPRQPAFGGWGSGFWGSSPPRPPLDIRPPGL